MILPLRSQPNVLCRVGVRRFPYGVRYFQLRYTRGGFVSGHDMESFLAQRLPQGSRWHAACLGAGEGRRQVSDDLRTGAVGVAGASGLRNHMRDCVELWWTDVMIDFGELCSDSSVDFGGDDFRISGRLPRVRACSGGTKDMLSEQWTAPWGGPFGYAYDCEYSMLHAPVEFWRSGVRLLTDIGDEYDWEVVMGLLHAQAVPGKGSDRWE